MPTRSKVQPLKWWSSTLLQNVKYKFKRYRFYTLYTQFRSWLDSNRIRFFLPVVWTFSRSGFLSSLYYAFFSRHFDLEHKAFLQARLEFLSRRDRPNRHPNALLRRNIHRLEKGLCMPSRKRVFAVDFIPETIGIYGKIVSLLWNEPTNEILWAHDVLYKYMEYCGNEPEIARYSEQFLKLPKPRMSTGFACDSDLPRFSEEGSRTPFTHNRLGPSALSFDEYEALVLRRRSVRWFTARQVEKEKLEKSFKLAQTSPSACNRIPYKFFCFDEPDKVSQCASLAMGTAGYADQIPALIVVVGDLANYFHERDRHLIYIDASLAAMTLIYALEVQGLSTCVINWSDVPEREKAMAKFLKLNSHERPIMLIATGYADGNGSVPYSSKKEADFVRIFNA